MDLTSARLQIQEALDAPDLARFVDVFVFGSVLTSPADADDLDLAVVYESPAVCAAVRDAIYSAGVEFPIHLIMLSPGEEQEYDFLAGVAAEPLVLGNLD